MLNRYVIFNLPHSMEIYSIYITSMKSWWSILSMQFNEFRWNKWLEEGILLWDAFINIKWPESWMYLSLTCPESLSRIQSYRYHTLPSIKIILHILYILALTIAILRIISIAQWIDRQVLVVLTSVGKAALKK